jgi:hypothetical protein
LQASGVLQIHAPRCILRPNIIRNYHAVNIQGVIKARRNPGFFIVSGTKSGKIAVKLADIDKKGVKPFEPNPLILLGWGIGI